MEFWVGEMEAVYRAAYRGAFEALLPDCDLKLLHGQIGRLQGQRGKGRETIGMHGAKFGELLVLEFNDLRGEIAFTVVPEGVDRQYLHIHGLRIHRREPLLEIDKGVLRPNIRAGL